MQMDDINKEEVDESPTNGAGDELDPTFVSQKKPMNRGAVGLLGLVLACGAGIYFLYLKNGPQSASAASPEQAAATSTVDEFLHGNGGSTRLMEQTLRETEKVVKEFQAYSAAEQVPLELLHTNPFRQHEAKPKASQDEGDQVANALAAARAAAVERDRVMKEAQALELQTLLRGARSACLINNALYHEGEQVGSFMVEEIRSQTVIVRQGKYRFELTMKR